MLIEQQYEIVTIRIDIVNVNWTAANGHVDFTEQRLDMNYPPGFRSCPLLSVFLKAQTFLHQASSICWHYLALVSFPGSPKEEGGQLSPPLTVDDFLAHFCLGLQTLLIVDSSMGLTQPTWTCHILQSPMRLAQQEKQCKSSSLSDSTLQQHTTTMHQHLVGVSQL